MDLGEEPTREITEELEEVRRDAKAKFDLTNKLIDDLEQKLVEGKLDKKVQALRLSKTKLDQISKELDALRSKYQHFFGERSHYDDADD